MRRVHRAGEGAKLRHLLEHPREARLSGEHERAGSRATNSGTTRARARSAAHATGRLELAVRVDELLKHPVERVGHDVGCRPHAREERRRHLNAARRPRPPRARVASARCHHQPRTRGQAGCAAARGPASSPTPAPATAVACTESGGASPAARTPPAAARSASSARRALVLRVALVEEARLGDHARERAGVDLVGARRDVRDAATGEARRSGPWERGEVGEREEAAVALAERHPAGAAELVPRAGARGRARSSRRGSGLQVVAPASRASPSRATADAVHPAGAPGAALVRQDHAGSGAPPPRPGQSLVRRGEPRARPRPGRTSRSTRYGRSRPAFSGAQSHAVEEGGRAAVEGGVRALGSRLLEQARGRPRPSRRPRGGRAWCRASRAGPRPQRSSTSEPGQVIGCDQRHVLLPYLEAGGPTRGARRRRLEAILHRQAPSVRVRSRVKMRL